MDLILTASPSQSNNRRSAVAPDLLGRVRVARCSNQELAGLLELTWIMVSLFQTRRFTSGMNTCFGRSWDEEFCSDQEETSKTPTLTRSRGENGANLRGADASSALQTDASLLDFSP